MVGFLDSSQLDFETYRNNLKDFLKSQAIYKDYDFEGSNMSVMLDLLARNTYHNGFYLNQVGSEMFLDTSQLRESVVSHAKELNYTPRSRSSSKAMVDIQVFPNDTPSLITIPKFFSMSSAAANGGNYVFSTNETINIRNNNGIYRTTGVEVFEGRVVTEYFVADTSSRYVVSSANVDISSLDVNVQNSQTDTANSTWTRAYNLYGLSSNSEVYFIQGAYDDHYELIFGNDVTGKAIVPGNIIRVTYRDCLASDADGQTRFRSIGNISGYTNINITLNGNSPSYGGAERESIDSIKFNAPRHFSTQERGIVKSDYATMIKSEFPQIETVAIFGGEELDQKRYGKVVIAIRPYGVDFAPNALKNIVSTYISDRCALGIDPIFVDPDYYYLKIDSTVYYNPALTSKTASDMDALVTQAVVNYGNKYLFDFSSDFRYSRLVSYIDSADTSIVSNDTVAQAIKRFVPTKQVASSTTFTFANQLRLTSDSPTITSSKFFMYNSTTGGTYTSFIEDDGRGNLYIYSYNGQNIKFILVNNIGTVDYNSGRIAINNVNVYDYAGHINLYALLQGKDFIITRNQILLIDPDDINVTIQKAQF